ncbi:hypothetical protein R1flu_022459 [Riccia fluitans]|uniref:Reverse transcriptase domain-containing protein n=1 Tax=Riccia fluitans TaxID=41844 RepID=A0ABD1XPC0_9MARC
MRSFMKTKQREQSTQISQIDELGKKLKLCHEALPPCPSDEQKAEIFQLETEKRKREHTRDRLVRIWSRARFVAKGDAPSKYFLSLHRKQILQHHFAKLRLPDGSETTNKTAITLEATRMFSTLYTSENRTAEARKDIAFILSKLSNKISDDQRKMLEELLSTNEIRDSLFSFPKGKVPGIDGTNAEALQAVWDFIEPVYLKVLQYFWSSGVLPLNWLEGIIKLIPKGESKERLTDWRPITLLNTYYKIIAKILATRLQLILPGIISPQQTGFIQGRNMMDNILSFWLTNDILIQQKRSGLFLKLDFEKAFDWVEHDYLWDTMNKLGFGELFIRLVQGLTEGAQTLIHINGTFSPRFDVLHGVRQGCPLAPLLLAISTKPLMALLREANIRGTLKPLAFGGSAVADFSLFADNMGVYLDLDESSFLTLRGIFSFFESASGARLNLHKSFALIIGTHNDMPQWLQRIGCAIMEHKKVYRYLGAPIGSGLSQDQMISFCLDRMVARLNLWTNKLLSFEGRVVLTKHILLTIPVFFLSTESIEKIARNFLWGNTEEGKHKRGLIPWLALKRGKRFGGLGFKDRFKRNGNIVRGSYQPQELLLLKRPTYPGKSYMAKSLIAAWSLTTKDLHWSPQKVLIPEHLTLRDLVSLIIQKDNLTNQELKEVMADLRTRRVTTTRLLWQKKEQLFTSGRTHLRTNTINMLRRLIRATGLAPVELHRARGWSWKKKDPVSSVSRPASKLYKITRPKTDWAMELNNKWGLKDSGPTWNRRWKLVWHSQVHLKDATFIWKML